MNVLKLTCFNVPSIETLICLVRKNLKKFGVEMDDLREQREGIYLKSQADGAYCEKLAEVDANIEKMEKPGGVRQTILKFLSELNSYMDSIENKSEEQVVTCMSCISS